MNENRKRIDRIYNKIDKISTKGNTHIIEYYNLIDEIIENNNYYYLYQALLIYYNINISNYTIEDIKYKTWKPILNKTELSILKKLKTLFDNKGVYQIGNSFYLTSNNDIIGQIDEIDTFSQNDRYYYQNKEFEKIRKNRKTFLQVTKHNATQSVYIDLNNNNISEDLNLVNRYDIAIDFLKRLQILYSFTEITRYGGTSSVIIDGTGGVRPYTGTGSFINTAGIYTYTITDQNSQISSATFEITEPDPIYISATMSIDILCYGGSGIILISATGGVQPYTGTGEFIANYGTYSYVVSDYTGNYASIDVFINQPNILDIDYILTPITHHGGTSTIIISATGGVQPYTGVGEFIVSYGTYSYTVTDDNNCESTINVFVDEPSEIVVSATYTPILCNGGLSVVTINATGGVYPYTGTGNYSTHSGTRSYIVSDYYGYTSSTQIYISQPISLTSSSEILYPSYCYGYPTIIMVTASGGTPPYTGVGTFSTYSYGNISSTVTDINGCISISTVLVYPSPDPILISIDITNSDEYGMPNGIATASVNGGIEPYAIDYYSATGSIVDNQHLYAGNYTVEVIDNNNCFKSSTFSITEPDPLSISITYSYVTSDIEGNGGIFVTASGGLGPYSYTWTNESSVIVSTSSILPSGLVQNDYILYIIDTLGLTFSQTFEVSETMTIGLSKVNVSSYGANDGIISVVASSPNSAPYNLEFNKIGDPIQYAQILESGSSYTFTSLSPGNYNLKISDFFGGSKIYTGPIVSAMVIT